MALSIIERWSPEAALDHAFQDVNESGLEGLKKHLTANALKVVEGFEKVSAHPGVSMLTNTLLGGDAVTVFLDKMSECRWIIKDVMKGSETSKAIVGFDYEDKMVGTIEMELIKEDKIWKIDNLGLPKFEKFTLPNEDEVKPAEGNEEQGE